MTALHSAAYSLCRAPSPRYSSASGLRLLSSFWALGSKRCNFLCAADIGARYEHIGSRARVKAALLFDLCLPLPGSPPFKSLGGWANSVCYSGACRDFSSFFFLLPSVSNVVNREVLSMYDCRHGSDISSSNTLDDFCAPDSRLLARH